MSESTSDLGGQEVTVEIHGNSSGADAMAGSDETKLNNRQIAAIQETVASLTRGFQPPSTIVSDGEFALSSCEIEIGFKIEAGAGSLIKLVFNGTSEASIVAKLAWKRT